MSSSLYKPFLTLVRLGIGHPVQEIPHGFDWTELHTLAKKHGLSAIILDGIDVLRQRNESVEAKNCETVELPPKQVMRLWIGEVLKIYENRYVAYQKVIGELAKFYHEHGFKLMVVKGYGLSLNYPNPSHRPCGDIDIWQFGQYAEADQAISAAYGLVVDKDHHHHTVFSFKGFSIENHYDFLNVHYGHRNDEIEKLLKEQAQDDSVTIAVEGEKVYLPNANLHALFMLRHALHNFASTDMNLRQVLDWAFFVEKHGKEVDWDWLLPILKEYHMMDYMCCMNAICVDDLGFNPDIFPATQFDPTLKERVLKDIISPEFSGKIPGDFVKRAVFKYQRWQANAWKQNLCYGDSRVKAFWQGAWSHLIKPSMI